MRNRIREEGQTGQILAEMRVYRFLGVRLFQRAVFVLERVRHRKDGGKNRNYHLRRLSFSSISKHYGYLSYNALIHFTGLAAVAAVAVLKCFFFQDRKVVDYALLFAVIANLYCIMLQRYNALRLMYYQISCRKSRRHRIKKKSGILYDNIPPDYDPDVRKQDIRWLGKMRKALNGRRDFFIADEDAVRLDRLWTWTDHAGLSPKPAVRTEIVPARNEDARQSPAGEKLYAGTDLFVAFLQKRFHRDRDRILLSYSVFTKGKKSEQAYSRLFPVDQEEAVLDILDMFCLPMTEGDGEDGGEIRF
ncbi:MAG: hypothetical protein Q4D81_03650 [Eubacteriales bacterium]|nr:hypothetical protein [Eubacteriales bacterium]